MALALTLLPEASQADPAPDPQTQQTAAQVTIPQVRHRIDQLEHQAERVTETANGLDDQMHSIALRLKSLRTDVARQHRKVTKLRAAIGDFASAQYRSGGTGVTAQLLTSNAPDEFLDRMAVSESVDAQQSQTVVQLAAEQKSLREKRSAQKAELARLNRAKTKAAEKRAEANRKLAEQKDLLQRLTEAQRRRLAALERQRQQRIAAEVARANRSQTRAAANTTDTATSTTTTSTTSSTDTGRSTQSNDGGSSGSSSSTGSADPAPSSSGAPSQRALTALAYAKAQLGKPYVFGAAGPNAFDCSGLTMMAWRAAGVSLPHLVSAQYAAVPHKVSISELEPGDLVMFYNMGHVGIYAGNGLVIHAPRPGESVQYLPMKYMPFAGAVRPG